jgi:hypothetical protein
MLFFDAVIPILDATEQPETLAAYAGHRRHSGQTHRVIPTALIFDLCQSVRLHVS